MESRSYAARAIRLTKSLLPTPMKTTIALTSKRKLRVRQGGSGDLLHRRNEEFLSGRMGLLQHRRSLALPLDEQRL
eukprot:1426-Hanusia_phi.AAC.2